MLPRHTINSNLVRSNILVNPITGEITEEIFAPPYKIVILKGGGKCGLVYVTALALLLKAHALDDVTHVVGSSIGGIGALFLALDFTPEEILEAFETIDFEDFLEQTKSSWKPEWVDMLGKLYTVVFHKNHGISSGKKFHEWIHDKCRQKLKKENPTFKDLAVAVQNNAINKTNFRYLSLTGANISLKTLEIYNHINTPDLPLDLGGRITASYPGAFESVTLEDHEKSKLSQEKIAEIERSIDGDNNNFEPSNLTNAKSVRMDGGLANNFAYYLAAHKEFLPEFYSWNEENGANPAILGLMVNDKHEDSLLWGKKKPKKLSSSKDYFLAMIDTALARTEEIKNQCGISVLQCENCEVDSLDFSSDDEQKNKLFNAGKSAAKEWLWNHVSEAYRTTTFASEQAWLNKKNLEEIVFLSHVHQQMWEEEQDFAKKRVIFDKLCWYEEYIKYRQVMDSNPQRIQAFTQQKQNLENKLQEGHLTIREKNQIGEDVLFLENVIHKKEQELAKYKNFKFTPHIDIKLYKPRAQMDDYIKAEMARELNELNTHIVDLQSNINDTVEHIHDLIHQPYLSILQHSDFIHYLHLRESLLLYQRQLEYLHNQMGNLVDRKYSFLEDLDKFRSRLHTHHFEEQNTVSNLFLNMLMEHFETVFFTVEVLFEIELFTPNQALAKKKIRKEVTFYLMDLNDFKCYMLGINIYLHQSKLHTKSKNDIQCLFKKLLGSEILPTGFPECAKFLGLEFPSAEFYFAVYKIEKLVQHFCEVNKLGITFSIEKFFDHKSIKLQHWNEERAQEMTLGFLPARHRHVKPDASKVFNTNEITKRTPVCERKL